MKHKKTFPLFVAVTTTLALFLLGLFLAQSGFFNPKIADDAQPEVTSNSANQAVKSMPRPDPKDTKGIRYQEQDNGSSMSLSLHEAALIDADGYAEIVPLQPPATRETLAKRLEEFSAAQGVLPVAYVDEVEDTDFARRLITRDIRVKMSQDIAKQFAAKHGLEVKELPTYAPEWVVFSAAQPLEALAKIPEIRDDSSVKEADVLLAQQMAKKTMPNDTLIGDQWHLKNSSGAAPGTDVNVESVWKYGEAGGLRGKNVKIGIVDDGLQNNHPDLSANADTANDKDWNGADNDASPNPTADFHGTACAGVAAARGNNSRGVSGVAPEARLIGLRLIAGAFTDLQTAQAMSHLPNFIQISSNSWGPFDTGKALDTPGALTRAAFENATTNGRNGKGTIFVWAGGNGGSASRQDNSNYDGFANSIYTIAVGAIDSSGNRSDYSERGANLVITAPSSGAALGITTADLTGANGYNKAAGTLGDYTDDFGGTSSATPAVSGVIALMLEANPDLGWRDVQDILIRSARKIKPGDSEWITNGAGLQFNHNFGAGLVDAEAAVTLAINHRNLEPQESVKSTQSGISQSIPNNNATGTEISFPILDSELITEHATVRLTINHSARGELEITLISPSGTESRLAELRNDTNANYSNFTLTTVRNWGENSSGVWRLKVADRRSTSNTTGGTITAAELTVYGAPRVNPPPTVKIATATNNSEFSPGEAYSLVVTAKDFNIDGEPDNITQVDLYENDILVDTATEEPYEFIRSPEIGDYIYVARATDPENLVGVSAPIAVKVFNKPPVVHNANVNPTGVQFDDQVLVVSDVEATDPENDSFTISYLWEFSTDGRTYTPSIYDTNTLPTDTNNSGKLWRCAVRGTDETSTGLPFYTTPVNLVDRPVESVIAGQSFTYQSGLVLEGDDLEINRQAIIHEFSQGPKGGTSEWIELLVLKQGSFANWKLSDQSGNTLTFSNTAVWENIPAGTLIVIYNSTTTKDPLVPADTTDPANGRLVLPSNSIDYFSIPSKWPSLDNSGDSIFLLDENDEKVHEIGYGISTDANPNIGPVTADRAAFFAGESDAGASDGSEWNLTTATKSRASSFAKSIGGSRNITSGIQLVDGLYVQDFNTDPGPDGVDFPEGWAAFTVNHNITQTTPVEELRPFQGFSDIDGAFNFGSSIGLYAGNLRFDPSFIGLGISNTAGDTGLKVSYDVTKILDQGRVMQIELQYTVGNPFNTNTKWTTVKGSLYRSSLAATGVPVKFSNLTMPPQLFNNRQAPIYLRWFYRTATSKPGTGGRDAIAIDNVIISSDKSPNVVSTLSIRPNTFRETAGPSAAVATLRLSQTVNQDVVFNILSSDVTEATAPTTVTIPAGQISTTFTISAIDDLLSDGSQDVVFTASATNFVDSTATVIVTDNEPVLNGVTPGYPNTVVNAAFIKRLLDGKITDPPLFQIAEGSELPDSLQLNPLTGLISGIIAPSVTPGVYTVVIELVNTNGGITSQSIDINVEADSANKLFSKMVVPGTSATRDQSDPDSDTLPSLVEYALGTDPNVAEEVMPIIYNESSTEISLTYKKLKDRKDVAIIPEWSETLAEGSWQSTDFTNTVVAEDAHSETIKSSLPVVPGSKRKYLRLRAELVPNP